jgi:hypothetical protein
MERRDGADSLDLVDMTARIHEPLSEQRLRWAVAKQ